MIVSEELTCQGAAWDSWGSGPHVNFYQQLDFISPLALFFCRCIRCDGLCVFWVSAPELAWKRWFGHTTELWSVMNRIVTWAQFKLWQVERKEASERDRFGTKKLPDACFIHYHYASIRKESPWQSPCKSLCFECFALGCSWPLLILRQHCFEDQQIRQTLQLKQTA